MYVLFVLSCALSPTTEKMPCSPAPCPASDWSRYPVTHESKILFNKDNKTLSRSHFDSFFYKKKLFLTLKNVSRPRKKRPIFLPLQTVPEEGASKKPSPSKPAFFRQRSKKHFEKLQVQKSVPVSEPLPVEIPNTLSKKPISHTTSDSAQRLVSYLLLKTVEDSTQRQAAQKNIAIKTDPKKTALQDSYLKKDVHEALLARKELPSDADFLFAFRHCKSVPTFTILPDRASEMLQSRRASPYVVASRWRRPYQHILSALHVSTGFFKTHAQKLQPDLQLSLRKVKDFLQYRRNSLNHSKKNWMIVRPSFRVFLFRRKPFTSDHLRQEETFGAGHLLDKGTKGFVRKKGLRFIKKAFVAALAFFIFCIINILGAFCIKRSLR